MIVSLATVLYPELAVQHVSMLLRSSPRYEIVKPLPEVGTRVRAGWFSVRDSQAPKLQKVLSWTEFGPARVMEDRALQSLAKSLMQIDHPYIGSYTT